VPGAIRSDDSGGRRAGHVKGGASQPSLAAIRAIECTQGVKLLRTITPLAIASCAACLLAGCPPANPPDDARTDDVADVRDTTIPGDVGDAADAGDALDAVDARDAADASDALDARDALDVPLADATDAPTDAPPLDGARCFSRIALPINVGDTLRGTLSGVDDVSSASCQRNTRGPEAVYELRVPAESGITVTTDSPATSVDTVLTIRRDPCSATPLEAGCNDNHERQVTSFVRAVLSPATYFVIVDQYASGPAAGGPFEIHVGSYTPAPNRTCVAPTSLSLATSISAQMIQSGATVRVPCFAAFDGPQLFYAVDVPAGRVADIIVTPSGAPWRPVVRVMTACDALSCDVAQVASADGMMVTAMVPSATAMRTLLVSVGAMADPVNDTSAFSIVANLR